TWNNALSAWSSRTALPGVVYKDPAVYEEEIQRIFLKSWHYVGHQSQIPTRGDYFLFEMAGESVIVVRDAEGNINALLNVCRHRGSRICDAATGHEARLVCRYHGWTYGLDGSLRAATQTPEGFDRSRYGLRRLHARVFAGLIFINFDADPASFDAIPNDLGAPLAPYQLDGARVAHRQNYPIASNWKLAVENYCECYHCVPAHPEYSVGHSRAIPRPEQAKLMKEVLARAPAAGLTQLEVRRSWLDAGAFGTDRDYDRYALMRGHRTGSKDGAPVAPLLGTIKDYDGGTADLHLGPMAFGLAYNDHVVLYRFTPRGMRNTDCEITWLVNESAVEGKDYERANLTWLWHVTTLADKEIIERNQLGVDSRFYEPGPLSTMEDFTRRFLEWYVATMLSPPAGGTLTSRQPRVSLA
ncbi:MAG: aromatic ring-hydroxylating oxygenase subunit alpha, partial [Steroidobacterales bacterium]